MAKFCEILRESEAKYIPLKVISQRLYPTWMTGKIMKKIKKINKLWRKLPQGTKLFKTCRIQ